MNPAEQASIKAEIDALRAGFEAAVASGDGWKAYREVASAAPPPGGWPGD